MQFLVTGAAGFIGSQLVERLLALGHLVRGIDCFSDYYSRKIKESNIVIARANNNFELWEKSILDVDIFRLLDGVEVIIHLAAQAGVRSSWGKNFDIYADNNILTTQRLLEAMREVKVNRMVYASSSSVYGDSEELPTNEKAACVPVSPYGVSKLAGELLCSLYHQNYGIDTVSLRYFTVYGPRQRPDMAFHILIRALIEGTEFSMFGDGNQSRDFTYIDDVIDATIAASFVNEAKGKIFNIGGGNKATLSQVVSLLEEITGKQAKVNKIESVKGDVKNTEADTLLSKQILNFIPRYDLNTGLKNEVGWIVKMLPVLSSSI